MFQSFRNQKRWLMLFAMILIIPAFVFIGINGYSRLNPDANAIAKVDGKGIQPEEFDYQKREFIETQRMNQGGKFDPTVFDSPEANAALLQQMASKRALQAQMAHHYMQISEADAINVIKNADAFKKDGQFSPELYQNYLAARGKSDQQFVYELRRDLVMDMLSNAVGQTVFIPKKTAELLNDILREERKVRTIEFDPASYTKDVKVTEAEEKQYYEEHKNDYQAPETIDIEYVVMSPMTMKVSEQPSEDELKAFYEQNKTRFGMPETRRASHILITPSADEKDAQKADQDAKAKAEKIYEDVKADPAKFAELAREHSEDSGSAQAGGDLDFFGKDQMVPEFDQAVFSARKGDILPPVKTEFGYHVIHVTDIAPASVKPFADVKAEIVKMWQDQQRQSLFAENADNFSNLVYEQSDSLEPVVEKFGLQLHKLNNLTKAGVSPSSDDAEYINKRVVEDLFSPDSLQEKRNTQAVEVASNVLVAARVVKHSPAHLMTFDEVKADIKALLEHQKASELAKVAGEKKLAELKANKDLNGFGHELTVSRVSPQDQAPALIQAELGLPVKSLPAFTGVQVPDGTYVISYVESSKMPKEDDSQAMQVRQSALRAQSVAEEEAYYEALKKLYKFEILKKEYDHQAPRAMK